jgi:hypothetical protein
VRTLRLHLWWTLVLVLAALGGAGLAVAADRPGNPVQRPELTYRADQAARPWIDHMAADLDTVQAQAADLATAGRNVLGSLAGLDRAGAATALTTGDQTAAAIATLATGLRDTENGAHAAIDRGRLGPTTVGLFDQADTASAAAEDVATEWHSLVTTAHSVMAVSAGFDGHDQAVFQATQAGRHSHFTDALALLNGAAADALASVSTARDQLAISGTVTTLDDLLARERTYDTALIALYQFLNEGGAQSGDQFTRLTNAVDRAQSALPSDNDVLVVISDEAAGVPMANALLALDKSRGSINDALEAISDARTGGQGTDQSPLETQSPSRTLAP